MHGRVASMPVVVKKDKLLATLMKNREDHQELCQEARNGYIEEAQKILAKKMERLRKGHAVSLHVTLVVPRDFTDTYDTAIEMLKWSVEDEIKLTGQEFRNLVMNEWDWMDDWLHSNMSYSSKVSALAEEKGITEDD